VRPQGEIRWAIQPLKTAMADQVIEVIGRMQALLYPRSAAPEIFFPDKSDERV